jgi:quercetin dioxygenase-like cupin family protein
MPRGRRRHTFTSAHDISLNNEGRFNVMKRLKKLRYSLPLVGIFAIGVTAAVVSAAQPPRPVATTIGSGALPNEAHAVIVSHNPMGTSARVAGVSEVRVTKFELAPGGAFPWHQHPGPVWVVVTKGTLTFYSASCNSQAYPTGSAFFDVGNLTHTARNEGSEPVEVIATFMFPADAGPAASLPQPAPDTCPIEV